MYFSLCTVEIRRKVVIPDHRVYGVGKRDTRTRFAISVLSRI